MPASLAAQDLTIVNIRVGQGDATLVQGPADANGDRVNVLFDAGDVDDRDGGHILRAVLWRWGVRELDFLVISHDDADHMGGAVTGPRHGESFILGWDNVPGDPGDDDNDGDTDWLLGRELYARRHAGLSPPYDPAPLAGMSRGSYDLVEDFRDETESARPAAPASEE